jgi:hypothetical protein
MAVMNENEDLIPAPEKGMVDSTTEAPLRLELTDLLLGRAGSVRLGRLSKGPTLEQGAVLDRIEAALDAYRSYFYPPEHR